MAVTVRVTSVRPFWDLSVDAQGDPDPAQRDALLSGVVAAGSTDLAVFSHGWNNDVSTASTLYDRFFAPFPGLLSAAPAVPAARFGYVGVHWPSMRFSDEPIPDFPHQGVAAPTGQEPVPGFLGPEARAALARVFPGREPVIGRLADLLAQQPADAGALDEFAAAVRTLTGGPADPATARFAQDLPATGGAPALLTGDPAAACQVLADALEQAGCPVAPNEDDGQALLGGLGKRVWDGARELLRQATYYTMRARAGTVGQLGLGPLLGQLAQRAPGVRIHLIGHSFGARLVSFALLGLGEDAAGAAGQGAPGVASVTLLQGAFSHYAFSGPLPFDSGGGALHAALQRVKGPLVACHSSHDEALGVLYPVASRLAGEDRSLLGLGDRWGALGHDGFQQLPGARSLMLADALAGPLPASGPVSVDASAVVCSGGPPSGAHSDICHEELARLVLRAAGRIPG